MIGGIKVHVPVRKQDDALKFYTEKLGFKVFTDHPIGDNQRWIELEIPGGDAKLVLLDVTGSLASAADQQRIGSLQPIEFWSNDVPGTSELLKCRGVDFVMDPTSQGWGTAAIFKDQDGNQFFISSQK